MAQGAGPQQALQAQRRQGWFRPRYGDLVRDAIGPAGVVIQPDYLDHAYALHVGEVGMVENVRGIESIPLPPELGWISPKRLPLFWAPAR